MRKPVALAIFAFVAVLLAAVVLRKGAVRGFVRAGPVHFGVEIDPDPPDPGESR